MSRLLLILVACAVSTASLAESGHTERPKPLPRPDMQPLSVERIQQIQGVAHAVLAAKETQTPDPRAMALRQALLDLRTEIGAALAPKGSLTVQACAEQPCAQAPAEAVKTERIAAKRQALAAAIAPAESEPAIAPLAKKAHDLDTEAGQALQSGDLAQLRVLYDELEPKSLMQLRPDTGKTIEPTFHTLTRHKAGVKSINP